MEEMKKVTYYRLRYASGNVSAWERDKDLLIKVHCLFGSRVTDDMIETKEFTQINRNRG